MAKSRTQIDNGRIPGLERAFGEILFGQRRAKGLTQEELGLRTDLARAYISRLEHGQQMPSLATLFLLAAELEMPAWEFLRIVEEKVKRQAPPTIRLPGE
ncbi:MAG: helix-turn-helix transcriptional regulator [Bacteroidota bacterium]